MFIPTFDVDDALPEILSPESVVVPKPVEETEKNDVLVVPAAFVDDAIENSEAFVAPYCLKTERFAVGVEVPRPRLPVDVSRTHSVRPAAEFLVENESAEAGEDVEISVNIDAIRAVEVADDVAFAQFASVQYVWSLNNMPVPMPLDTVPVAVCVRENTSVIPPMLASCTVAESAGGTM